MDEAVSWTKKNNNPIRGFDGDGNYLEISSLRAERKINHVSRKQFPKNRSP